MKKALFLIASFWLSSCNAPQEIDNLGENTVETIEEVGTEIGKERQMGEDVLITPEQEEKVKIRF